MNPLEARLKYKFRNPLLLAEALTHASVGHETQRYHFDNQRLEYLGDAVLQLIFTEHLFERFPNGDEGMLTKARARLVSREGLRHFAQTIELGRFLMLGRGEEASGGRDRSSVLSDAFEALVGAIYLDSDYVTVRRVVLTAARDVLEEVDISAPEANPKGLLQEILQAISPVSPKYPIAGVFGPEHDKRFSASVTWCGLMLGEGEGRSKKEAEVAAARDAMHKRVWETQTPAFPEPATAIDGSAPTESTPQSSPSQASQKA